MGTCAINKFKARELVYYIPPMFAPEKRIVLKLKAKKFAMI